MNDSFHVDGLKNHGLVLLASANIIGVSCFAQTPDAQGRRRLNNRYAFARRSVLQFYLLNRNPSGCPFAVSGVPPIPIHAEGHVVTRRDLNEQQMHKL
jgi:hypothetical protein